MSPVHAVRSALRHYAVFSGRATRPELWWFAAAYVATAVVTSVIDTLLFGQVMGLVGVMPLTWAVIAASIVPMLALAVRRLHDSGRSGWWYLVQAVPLAGPVWLLVLLCSASDPLPNAYGAPRTAAPVRAGGAALVHGRA